MRILWVVPLLALASCALTTGTVTPPAQPLATGVTGGNQRAVQLHVPLADARPDKTRCGMKKNGYNMETANFVCSAEPVAWLGELLAAELRAAGFTVVEPTGASATALRVEGQLLQYFVEPKMGFFTFTPEADIHVRLVATSAAGLRAERHFYVKGEETSVAGFESNFQSASDAAVRQVVRSMVTALRDLMDRYPGTGAALPAA